jgi:hypothetical protein
MKRAIRISILIIGIMGTFVAATVLPVPAVADGGPIFTCPQPTPECGVLRPPGK